jgi:transcriptional antiterminator RfaH
MPVLPLEPYIQPENLLASDQASRKAAGYWWALHVRSRAEKELSRRLRERGLSFFLPLFERRWKAGRRQRRSYLPLFPGYLFLHGDDEQRLLALETNLVVRSLPIGDQRRLQADLMRVHQLMTSGAPLAPEERILPGTQVEIVSGPLTGLRGTVVERRLGMTFVVDVSFLQRGVSVQIDGSRFRPL